MTKDKYTHLAKILEILNVGPPVTEPVRVYGGLLHTMWKVITEKGVYAVKQLSESVDLKDEKVRKNYELTESIAHRFSAKGVPAVSAVGQDGRRLAITHGVGFLVYPWIEAGSMQSAKLPELKIASLLAKLHLIDLQVPEIVEPEFVIHSNDNVLELIRQAEHAKAPFAKLLRERQNEILEVNEAFHAAIPTLKEQVVVSHGDLDQKNVLWNMGEPVLIDWESARKLNPTYETINASLDWSGITTDTFDKELFVKMVHTYQHEGGKLNKDHIHASFQGALGNWVNWMLYNVNRACAAEEPEFKALGIEQVNMVLPTIPRLREFHEEIRAKKFFV